MKNNRNYGIYVERSTAFVKNHAEHEIDIFHANTYEQAYKIASAIVRQNCYKELRVNYKGNCIAICKR